MNDLTCIMPPVKHEGKQKKLMLPCGWGLGDDEVEGAAAIAGVEMPRESRLIFLRSLPLALLSEPVK